MTDVPAGVRSEQRLARLRTLADELPPAEVVVTASPVLAEFIALAREHFSPSEYPADFDSLRRGDRVRVTSDGVRFEFVIGNFGYYDPDGSWVSSDGNGYTALPDDHHPATGRWYAEDLTDIVVVEP